MTARLRRHLTISNALAFTALFIALGAGAFAAGLGRNSVKSKQITDGAVATKDLKDGSLGGREIADGSLSGSDVSDDSLTGTDISEAGLQVPTAANANQVGGLGLKEIDFQSPIANGVAKTILDFPGIFRIEATCANVGEGLDLVAFTSVANSRISMVGWKANSNGDAAGDSSIDLRASEDFVFNPGETFLIDNNLPTPAVATHDAFIQFSTPTGFVATVEIFTAEFASDCRVIGTAVGG